MHSYLINDHLKVLKPEAYRLLNDCHLIHCTNHVLNILFQATVKSLKTDSNFDKALTDVTKLAKLLKKSSLLRASLSHEGLPLVPVAPQTRLLYVWRQLDAYLKHRDRYFNRLPNAASFYYTMKEFYRLCSCAGSEDRKPALEGTFDFTFIFLMEDRSYPQK